MHAVFRLVSSLSHCAATSKHLGLIAPGHESFYPGLCWQKGVPTFCRVLPVSWMTWGEWLSLPGAVG